ncbi:hypothetical protein [Citrobacter braakii]|uniref:hypothetical protein n=1 Tax=Citrobacter braakii TaxID=57706 RepID=UPI002B2501CB|nr:hypothetical protein [Citrobacter braakii]MEB2307511.1 hypothetical protein [Citrobacter braakii]
MKAAMKMASGMVPVALGVTIVLVSGMARAEDKAAQPQPLTGAVSAKTTQPSVGHRPVITSARVFAGPGSTDDITLSSTHVKTGGQLFVNVDSVADVDSDPFTAPLNSSFYCTVYGLNGNAPDSLVAENVPCVNGPQGAIPISITTNNLLGKRVAVDIYAHSDASAAQSNGYTPSPLKSLAYRVTSSNTVVDATPAPFLRPAYAVVNGKRIEVDRGDPANPYDDVISLPSAFAGAEITVFIEGGTPVYHVNTGDAYSAVVNSPDTHSAKMTIKDNFINSTDGMLTFGVVDSRRDVINFKIKIAKMFLSKPIKASWHDAKTDCEGSGYKFPYLGTGAVDDPTIPGTLAHSTLFWGGYSKYSFPNASEFHWTGSEYDSLNGFSMRLNQPNNVISQWSDKNTKYNFVCKKVF